MKIAHAASSHDGDLVAIVVYQNIHYLFIFLPRVSCCHEQDAAAPGPAVLTTYFVPCMYVCIILAVSFTQDNNKSNPRKKKTENEKEDSLIHKFMPSFPFP